MVSTIILYNKNNWKITKSVFSKVYTIYFKKVRMTNVWNFDEAVRFVKNGI